ncbi:MAG: type II toxin-antitoxin system prevent-host-death family antitoxin [Bryobacteraceae bacterium]
MTFNVHEAKTQLSKLLDLIEQGEEVVIVRHGRPAARLVLPQTNATPQLGAMQAEIHWTEGWEKPLAPEAADAFWEGRW